MRLQRRLNSGKGTGETNEVNILYEHAHYVIIWVTWKHKPSSSLFSRGTLQAMRFRAARPSSATIFLTLSWLLERWNEACGRNRFNTSTWPFSTTRSAIFTGNGTNMDVPLREAYEKHTGIVRNSRPGHKENFHPSFSLILSTKQLWS